MLPIEENILKTFRVLIVPRIDIGNADPIFTRRSLFRHSEYKNRLPLIDMIKRESYADHFTLFSLECYAGDLHNVHGTLVTDDQNLGGGVWGHLG